MRDDKGKFIKGFKPSQESIDRLVDMNKKRAKPHPKIHCIFCNKEFEVFHYRKNTAKFCSPSCRSSHTAKKRSENPIPIKRSKYMFIKNKNYHRANKQGYAKICDMVAEEKEGRLLKENEIVHHIDGNKLNDSPDNLQIMDRIEHDRMHTKERWANGEFYNRYV